MNIDRSVESIVFLSFCSFAIFFFAHIFFAVRNSKRVLEAWAKLHRMTIINRTLSLISKGPFTFNTTIAQPVFRLTLTSSDGEVIIAWARFESMLFGFLPENNIKVIIDHDGHNYSTNFTLNNSSH